MEEIKEEKKVKKPRAPRAKKQTAAEEVAATAAQAVEEAPVAIAEEKPAKTKKPRAKKTETAQPQTQTEAEQAPAKAPAKAKRTPKKQAEKTAEAAEETLVAATAEEKPVKAKKPRTKKAAAAPAPEEPKTQPQPQAAAEEAQTPAPPQRTRAEKTEAAKAILKELLQERDYKWKELLEKAAAIYRERYADAENEDATALNGFIGSLKGKLLEDKEIVEENHTLKLVKEPKAEAQTPAVEVSEQPTAVVEVKAPAPAVVHDMTLLFDHKKPAQKPIKTAIAEEAAQREEEQQPQKTAEAPAVAEVERPTETKTEPKKPQKEQRTTASARKIVRGKTSVAAVGKADPLKEKFLKKLRSLGGDYFEYYAVYLLERHARRNGMRLEALRVSGGDNDGGIDGEIEITNRIGFRETIYVQAKNWQPTDEKWMVGETLLREFIGAVTYRQAITGKQNCRGIFITTSCFTSGAKEMLEKLEKFVGYDGEMLFETAKECEFGLKKTEKGDYIIDEALLKDERALFYML
ncbi:MAG: restriction endonuclease [Clostridia bacterium]|nr:restriction endonuclease [Clostridia bacterium]